MTQVVLQQRFVLLFVGVEKVSVFCCDGGDGVSVVESGMAKQVLQVFKR